MIRKFTASLAVLLFLAFGAMASAHAADQPASMTGTWNVTVQLPIGTGTPIFVVVQDGSKLTGTYKGALGESPVSGTIEGDSFRLLFTAAGVEAEYAGVLNGDEISGTAKLKGLGEGSFKGSRAP